ncbi:hypothetical protein ES332_A11G238400v1 [Gossypium tomentosum]|uniref:Arabinogalactan peptide 20 n=1 Tax=Gossypium tomentosum TaxID=34277 RepID=A0A5D2NF60_GOSTO|nr:hypothetical protein ES332_A11G238400v1 [Gossypium tomentosum]
MAVIFFSVLMRVVTIFALVFAIVSPKVEAQSAEPAPSPISDVLILVALVLTYLIHPLDASSCTFF